MFTLTAKVRKRMAGVIINGSHSFLLTKFYMRKYLCFK